MARKNSPPPPHQEPPSGGSSGAIPAGGARGDEEDVLSRNGSPEVHADPGASTVTRDAETLELITDFLEESFDGLARIDEILLQVDGGSSSAEDVNAVFRVFHTIKGVAGFLEITEVSRLAHVTESLLDQVREGALALEGAVLEAVLEATGAMRGMLGRVKAAAAGSREFPATPELARLVALIEDAASADPVSVEREDVSDDGPAAPAAIAASPGAAGEATPEVKLRQTLKVDLERVDSMVEMVGELIIVESMVVHAPEIAALLSLKIRNYLSQLSKISRDLQDVSMRMRMVPVRGVFRKMARLVHELSRKTGKQVVLVPSGEATEMDRSMAERIEEPLVHMIRNSVDHGIEGPDERAAMGKPAQATIRLSAFHEGGSIVVEVADDGRGLMREPILKKALSQGLVRDGDALSDAQVHSLIFAPGFSTAAKVTEISGRGVGLDVVKRNVEAMRGRVMVESPPGQGTTFRLVLPLTLAIIDGMLVACGPERYIIPSLSIVESLQPRPGMLQTFAGQDELLNVRGEILPLFRLSRLFEVGGAQTDATQALAIVVESMGRKVALLVDDVLAQQQVVIKPLGSGLQHKELFSGAAILSDGRVGLILNVDRICNQVSRAAYGAAWDRHEEARA